MKRVLCLVCLCMSFVNAACAYTFQDLPVGWPWDPLEIQGTILPAVPNGAAGDLDTWLRPIGEFDRVAVTNQYVSEIRVVSNTASVGVFLQTDPDKKTSITWTVEGWSTPGCWYVVVDAVSPAGKSGQTKTQRYTLVGAGYVPDDAVPYLE